jgi:uncharacterized protein (DUF58 family)
MSRPRFASKVRQYLNNTRITLMVALLFTLMVASIFPTPPIIFMSALLVTAPMMGSFAGKLFSRGLTVTRTLPDVGSVGDTITGRLTIHNDSPFPSFFVRLHNGGASPPPESLLTQRPTSERKINERKSKIGSRPLPGVGDRRLLSYSKFPAVQVLSEAEHTLPVLRAHARKEWRAQWKLQRRGVWQLPAAQTGVFEPLGVFSSLAPCTSPHTITVLPRPLKIARLGFLGGADTGLHSPQYAASVAEALDFHGIRPWRPGDGIRRVHWKNTARTGQLHIIEWEETLACDLTVLLDVQRQPEDVESGWFEAAITLTASIAVHLLENGYTFQLICWQYLPGANASENPLRLCHHRARNSSGVGATLRLLAELQPLEGPEASLEALAQRAPSLIARGVGTVTIASDESPWQQARAALNSGASGALHTTLLLDAASFRETAASEENGARPQPARSGRGRYGTGVRKARSGDSLAELLEM